MYGCSANQELLEKGQAQKQSQFTSLGEVNFANIGTATDALTVQTLLLHRKPISELPCITLLK